jgi:hypothetical protein
MWWFLTPTVAPQEARARVISFPTSTFAGLVLLVPLLLAVALIEALVFRRLLRTPLGPIFKILLTANVWSMLFGLPLLRVQVRVPGWLGIRSLYDFVHYYIYGAMLIIVLYYFKSVLIEGLCVAQRAWVEKFGVSYKRLWCAVAIANVASYLLVGPVLYYSTRADLHGIHFEKHPQQVTTCTDTIYFVSSERGHLEKIHADGTGRSTVVPFFVSDFIVVEDGRAFLYSTGGDLWLLRLGGEPARVGPWSGRRFRGDLDLSADRLHIAYATPSELAIMSVATGQVVAEADLECEPHANALVAWDSSRPDVIHCDVGRGRTSWRLEGGKLVPLGDIDAHPVGNYRRWPGLWRRVDGNASRSWEQDQGDLTLRRPRGILINYVSVRRGDESVAYFGDGGLFGPPGPNQGSFLSRPGLVVCEGAGSIYILDALNKRVALLAEGRDALAAIPRFQASFDEPDREVSP